MRVLPYNAKQWEIPLLLNGRKTVTRRPVRYKYSNTEMKMRTDKYGTRLIEIQKDVEGETYGKNEDGSTWHKLRGYIEPKPSYQPGDILYVRETWLKTDCFGFQNGYVYKADETPYSKEFREDYGFKWKPSIRMPKEAARIWLKVTDVRVERLQEITPAEVVREGAYPDCWDCLNVYGNGSQCCYKQDDECSQCDSTIQEWEKLWNSTIKKFDLDRYGWDANPWVWVIEFERCEKPEED